MLHDRTRTVTRGLLGALYLAAAAFHLFHPAPFLSIMPAWVPMPAMVVTLTGWAEGLGALALLQPWSAPLRRVAGWSLAAYALCVWPANVEHMLRDLARDAAGQGGTLPLWYHLPRLAAQPLLIWAAPWSAGAWGRPA